MPESDGLTDQGKLLFGAGFVFGVTTTLLILAVVLVAVTRGETGEIGLTPSVVATLAGGVLFAGIVGVGLYYLAFPGNRAQIEVDPEQFGLDDEE